MYENSTNLLLDVFADLTLVAIIILTMALAIAGGTFLIRWGFKVAKNAMNGEISDEERKFNNAASFRHNVLEKVPKEDRQAFLRGAILNRRNNILQ